MSRILNEPRVVLWVGPTDALGAGRSTLAGDAVREVITVETAADARDYLDSHDGVGCVVTAASLPDGSGVELCGALREAGERTPVAVVAERDQSETVAAALRAGADECLYVDEDESEVRSRIEALVERHCSRQADAERARLFSTLLDETPVAIYAKDDEARHIAISEMPGDLSRSDVIGKTDVEMYQGKPTFAQEALADDMAVVEDEERIEERLESYGPEGQKNWALTSKFPWYRADGSVGGLLGVTQNITEYKRTENRLDAMEERVDAFTSHLQHDLKTPLQIASGHLQLARDTDAEASFDKIESALDRIEEMVDDLGSMTKLERSTESFEQTVALNDLVEGVWSVVETEGATLSADLHPDTRIHADENTLRPVFENLFKNAITHAGPDVSVTVGTTEQGGFYVADDGPGIPTEERDAVLESGYSNSQTGSGKGLHIVAETVADNDWDLVVTESATGGARFEINNCLMVDAVPEVDDGPALALDEQDTVGSLSSGGDADYHEVADRWLVTADGSGISEGTDDCYYVYRTVTGPVSIRGHVTDIQHINDFSTAGLAIRDSLDRDAAFGSIQQTLRFGTEVGWRAATGGEQLSQNVDESDTFTWYRIDRIGDRLTCYVSTNGREWVPVDQREVELADEVHVGLLATSSVPDREARFTFEGIEVVELDQ